MEDRLIKWILSYIEEKEETVDGEYGMGRNFKQLEKDIAFWFWFVCVVNMVLYSLLYY
ncbi:MAG: hypothetical protein PHC75_10870 [Burkholderiales bacterium]|nr:hypothetical protein [Burkholderiales bacterium]